MRQTALGSEYWNQLPPALQEVISRHFAEPLDEFLRDVLQECQNVPIEEALRGLRLFMSSLEMPRAAQDATDNLKPATAAPAAGP
jgi:hypothetical protein